MVSTGNHIYAQSFVTPQTSTGVNKTNSGTTTQTDSHLQNYQEREENARIVLEFEEDVKKAQKDVDELESKLENPGVLTESEIQEYNAQLTKARKALADTEKELSSAREVLNGTSGESSSFTAKPAINGATENEQATLDDMAEAINKKNEDIEAKRQEIENKRNELIAARERLSIIMSGLGSCQTAEATKSVMSELAEARKEITSAVKNLITAQKDLRTAITTKNDAIKAYDKAYRSVEDTVDAKVESGDLVENANGDLVKAEKDKDDDKD